MKKYFTYSLLAILLLTLLVYPSFAWFYNDFPEPGKAADTKFEMFGPRVDRLLIKLYSQASAEWDALKATPQELDLTDTPLDYNYYNQFIQPPYDAKVNVESVGGEFGLRNLDMNQNNNPYLGAPQNPAYPNPVKTIGGQAVENPVSDVNFRKAILSCIDRTYYVANIIGSGFAVEHWSMLPPATGIQYYQETFKIYPYSLINARDYLIAGNFKNNTVDGHVYWDLNSDNDEDPNELVDLHFVIREDDPHRNAIGIHLANQLSLIGINVTRDFLDITGARTKWMMDKNAHLYTAGWSLGIEPDSIVLWMGDAGVGADLSYYWHPGTCYNTAY
ncbi:MAG: ABC transporter substrate-binding protein, partial [Candidatus Bathyarchaeota archaeon]|nr:ABC transporter substrate-binding protein [Candidatus Bathyarchaeota archaeon]